MPAGCFSPSAPPTETFDSSGSRADDAEWRVRSARAKVETGEREIRPRRRRGRRRRRRRTRVRAVRGAGEIVRRADHGVGFLPGWRSARRRERGPRRLRARRLAPWKRRRGSLAPVAGSMQGPRRGDSRRGLVPGFRDAPNVEPRARDHTLRRANGTPSHRRFSRRGVARVDEPGGVPGDGRVPKRRIGGTRGEHRVSRGREAITRRGDEFRTRAGVAVAVRRAERASRGTDRSAREPRVVRAILPDEGGNAWLVSTGGKDRGALQWRVAGETETDEETLEGGDAGSPASRTTAAAASQAAIVDGIVPAEDEEVYEHEEEEEDAGGGDVFDGGGVASSADGVVSRVGVPQDAPGGVGREDVRAVIRRATDAAAASRATVGAAAVGAPAVAGARARRRPSRNRRRPSGRANGWSTSTASIDGRTRRGRTNARVGVRARDDAARARERRGRRLRHRWCLYTSRVISSSSSSWRTIPERRGGARGPSSGPTRRWPFAWPPSP